MRDEPTPERARALHARRGRALPRGWRAHAAALFGPGTRALTHCNAGGLATGGYGSAVGALRAAWERGLLAARLGRRDAAAPPGLAPDGLGARGARHPARGDRRLRRRVADGARRGRLRRHGRRPDRRERRHREQDRHLRAGRARAPTTASRSTSSRRRSTIDLGDGDRRGDPDRGARRATRSRARFAARNPAFDVTPAALIAAIVTEEGVHRAPYAESLPRVVARMKAIILAAGLRDAPAAR